MEPSYSHQPSEIFPDRPVAVYASFWARFAASLIDGLIVGVPVSIIRYMLGDFDTDGFQAGFGFNTTSNPLGSLINLVAGWLYSALLESGASQATIGKRALGLKVTGMDGERISFGKATGRHFGKIISAIILLIGYLMMLWDDKKQTLHDKMAGTLVVKA